MPEPKLGCRCQFHRSSVWQDVRLGVNAVTRALEGNGEATEWKVGVIVVANRGVRCHPKPPKTAGSDLWPAARPPALLQHVLVMAAARQIPVVALGVDSVAFGEVWRANGADRSFAWGM